MHGYPTATDSVGARLHSGERTGRRTRRARQSRAAPYARSQRQDRVLEQDVSQGILQRIAAGDQAAIAECVDAYGDLIWSIARKMLRSHEDAEDVVQEVYIDLWSHAGRFDPSKGSETTFVATIARRRLIDRVRKISRQPAYTDDVTEMGDVLEAPQSVDAGQAADVERADRVISGLKPKQQEVLRMSIYEGYSHGDIATRLDMPLGTVKTLLRRGLIRIREELETTGGGTSQEVLT
jgi:RNA polymerase sigma factor (sigma-70 family)